jgi:hypothetical protein
MDKWTIFRRTTKIFSFLLQQLRVRVTQIIIFNMNFEDEVEREVIMIDDNYDDNKNEVVVVEESEVEAKVEAEPVELVEPVEHANSTPTPSKPASPAPPENADPLPAADGFTSEEVREVFKNTGLVIEQNKMTKPVRMPLKREDPLEAVTKGYGNICCLAPVVSSKKEEILFVGFENDVVEVYVNQTLKACLAAYDPYDSCKIISINYCEDLGMVAVQIKRPSGGSYFRFYDMMGKRYANGMTVPACGRFNAAFSTKICYEQDMVSFHLSSGLFVHCPSTFFVTVYQARSSNHTNMKTFVVERRSKFTIGQYETIQKVVVLPDETILFQVNTANDRALPSSRGIHMLQTTLDGVPLSIFPLTNGYTQFPSVTVSCFHFGVLVHCAMYTIFNRLRMKTYDLTGTVIEENVAEKDTPFRYPHFGRNNENTDKTVQCSTTGDAGNTPVPFRQGGGLQVYERDTKLLFPVFNTKPTREKVAGVKPDLYCHIDDSSRVAVFGGKVYYTTPDGLFCMHPQAAKAEKPKWTALLPELVKPPEGFNPEFIEKMSAEEKLRHNLPKHPRVAFPLISLAGGYRKDWTDATNYLYHRSIREKIFYIFMCNERLKKTPGRRFLPPLCLFDVFRELVATLVTPRCVREKTVRLY